MSILLKQKNLNQKNLNNCHNLIDEGMFMNFQSKKYFLVLLFSATSIVCSNNDQDDPKTEKSNVRQMIYDYSKRVKDCSVRVTDSIQRKIQVINRDPGLGLDNGLTWGCLIGAGQLAILKGMQRFRGVQAVASFGLPAVVVSYLVAERNLRIRDLEYSCNESEKSKK